MRRVMWAPAALLVIGIVVLSGAIAADGAKNEEPNKFDLMKRLVGEWMQVGDDGKPTDVMVLRSRLTAGGSAILEEIFPDTEHEMVTVYHADGDQVLLTHFCMLGNAPRMKLQQDSTKEVWKFTCDGQGSNMVETDMHMHQGILTWKDEDHFVSSWSTLANGEVGEPVTFSLVRKR
jgi:hypothetical protein